MELYSWENRWTGGFSSWPCSINGNMTGSKLCLVAEVEMKTDLNSRPRCENSGLGSALGNIHLNWIAVFVGELICNYPVFVDELICIYNSYLMLHHYFYLFFGLWWINHPVWLLTYVDLLFDCWWFPDVKFPMICWSSWQAMSHIRSGGFMGLPTKMGWVNTGKYQIW
jgi:hypothetical protein